MKLYQKKGYNIIIRNTICNATEERQTEAREIAKRVDANDSNRRTAAVPIRENCMKSVRRNVTIHFTFRRLTTLT